MLFIRRFKQWIIDNSNVLIVLLPVICGIISLIGKLFYLLLRSSSIQRGILNALKDYIFNPYFIDTLQIALIFCVFWVLVRIHGLIFVNDKESIWLKLYLRRWSSKIYKSDEAIDITTQVVSGTCNQFYIMWLIIWGIFLCYYMTDLYFKFMFNHSSMMEVLDYVQLKDFIQNILNFASSAAMYAMYIVLNNVTMYRKVRSKYDNHKFERGIVSLIILFFFVIISSSYATLLDSSEYGEYQFVNSLCLSCFSTFSFILLLGRLNSNHLMMPSTMLYGLYIYAMAQMFSPFMNIFLSMEENTGHVELYVPPGSKGNDYLPAVFQYITLFGKIILTFMIIWIAKEYRLMYFVLHKSLSLEQTPKRKKFFFQFMSSSDRD